jgi:hypothetical protein
MIKLIVAFSNITHAPKISAFTSQKTHSVPIMKTDLLLLLTEIIFVHSENHREYINTLRGPGGGGDNVKFLKCYRS